jgi:hypothetical protein
MYLCSTGLDYDCKKWRLFADILNDVAMLTELLTPRQHLFTANTTVATNKFKMYFYCRYHSKRLLID